MKSSAHSHRKRLAVFAAAIAFEALSGSAQAQPAPLRVRDDPFKPFITADAPLITTELGPGLGEAFYTLEAQWDRKTGARSVYLVLALGVLPLATVIGEVSRRGGESFRPLTGGAPEASCHMGICTYGGHATYKLPTPEEDASLYAADLALEVQTSNQPVLVTIPGAYMASVRDWIASK